MTRIVGGGVVLLAGFLVLGLLVRTAPSNLDTLLRGALADNAHDGLGAGALAVGAVLGPALPVTFGAVLAIATVVWWRRGDRRASVTFRVLILLLACRLTSVVAKPLFDRHRPRVYPDWAYPSGHVVSVAATGFAAVVLCLWLAPSLAARVRWVAIVATALSAAARIVAGVHWLTDTVGSVLVVGGVGLLVGAALRLLPAKPVGVASSS